MEWAPEQVYETVGHGCRRVVAWVGDWVCNCCGRTFSQNDGMLRMLRDGHACGMGVGCRLSIDFQQGVFTWMCGESGSLISLPSGAAGGGAETLQNSIARGQPEDVDSLGFLAALPPLANDESTNSFLYCPVLLHAANLLRPHAVIKFTRSYTLFRLFARVTHEIYFIACAPILILKPVKIIRKCTK